MRAIQDFASVPIIGGRYAELSGSGAALSLLPRLLPRLPRLRLQSRLLPLTPPLDLFLPFACHLNLSSPEIFSPTELSVPPLHRNQDGFQPKWQTPCPCPTDFRRTRRSRLGRVETDAPRRARSPPPWFASPPAGLPPASYR